MKRDYQNDYPSVTQVLGILRKIGLEKWFLYNTSKFCNEKSKRGREIGTQIHAAIQDHIEAREVKIETQYGNEVMNALKSFMLFRKEHPEIILQKAEMTLTSEEHKYNGTLDCIGDDGIPVVADWKSGECKDKDKPPIYDEYVWQVAAYVRAYNEQEKMNIERAYILAFAKDKISYNLQLVSGEEIEDVFENGFLPALQIYNLQKRRK